MTDNMKIGGWETQQALEKEEALNNTTFNDIEKALFPIKTPKQKLIEAVKGRRAYIGTIYETRTNAHLFEQNEFINDIVKLIERILPDE